MTTAWHENTVLSSHHVVLQVKAGRSGGEFQLADLLQSSCRAAQQCG